jgi:Coenzyme PQQ synthesis protein D (PqqD)
VLQSGCRRKACNVYAPLIEGSSASADLRLRSADLFWQAIDGDVLVLDLRKELYLEVNRSGALLWELLARGTRRTELVDRLVRAYDLAPERALSDVDRLLEELSARDLLERPTPG